MKKSYLSYPYKPFLLTSDNYDELENQYNTLCKTPQSQIDPALIFDLAKHSGSGLYRKVVLFNEESKEFDKIFEQTEPCSSKRPLAFMFAGIGNQYRNMTYGLYNNVDYFKELFDECSVYLETILECDIRDIVFGGDDPLVDEENYSPTSNYIDFKLSISKFNDTDSTSKELLYQTKYSHAILFTVEYCLAKTIMHMGIVPDALIGHSVGEYTAVAVSGVMPLNDVLTLVARRALMIDKLQSGQMMTILTEDTELRKLLAIINGLYLAAENSPISYTVSGTKDAIANAEKYLEEADILFYKLPANRAFHSVYMEPIEKEFKAMLSNLKIIEPKIPFLSNVTGDWITKQQLSDADNWFMHTCKTVRFSSGIQKLIHEQNSILVEIGPGQVLSSFVYQHRFDKNQKITTISSLRDVSVSISDSVNLLFMLCKLWVNGCNVDWNLFLNL
jgi:phthiocerol/phenolphthiocerol synthesis type-I polyketide synthase E|nr:acyltransferase domain-containing protein [uncultured Lachnoclostridium sp.]